MADRELDKLAQYLLYIANVNDFRTLSHKVSLLTVFPNDYMIIGVEELEACCEKCNASIKEHRLDR